LESNTKVVSCGHVFDGTINRDSLFRLMVPKDLTLRPRTRLRSKRYGNEIYVAPIPRRTPPVPFQCQIEFMGKPADVVQLAVIKYHLR